MLEYYFLRDILAKQERTRYAARASSDPALNEAASPGGGPNLSRSTPSRGSDTQPASLLDQKLWWRVIRLQHIVQTLDPIVPKIEGILQPIPRAIPPTDDTESLPAGH
jgi:hypothetical protein